MAGRILPVALATVSGIAIGMATFGEELKSQRMKRLTEEFNRDVAAAAAAAANNGDLTANAPASTITTPPPASTIQQEETKPTTTSWSDALGFWAWKKSPQKDAVPAALASPAVRQTAPAAPTNEEQVKKP